MEWDLSSGDVIEHKVHDVAVIRMAVSGDKIVTSDAARVIRVFNVSTCLSIGPSSYLSFIYDGFCCS